MAFPSRPVLNVGTTLDATDVQALDDYLVAVTPLYAHKTVDQSVNNASTGTTLVNATELSLALLASAKYKLFGSLYLNAGTTADVKIAATAPSGATGYANCRGEDPAAPNLFSGTYVGANTAFTTAFVFAGAGSIVEYEYRASVTTTNSGTFQIQFAQNVADAAATTMLSGSNLYAWRVG